MRMSGLHVRHSPCSAVRSSHCGAVTDVRHSAVSAGQCSHCRAVQSLQYIAAMCGGAVSAAMTAAVVAVDTAAMTVVACRP